MIPRAVVLHRMRISTHENGGLLLSQQRAIRESSAASYGSIEDSRLPKLKIRPRGSFSMPNAANLQKISKHANKFGSSQ
jgi:hypothetical protein